MHSINQDNVFNQIIHCEGKGNCWGIRNPRCHKPVVLPCGLQPEIMIITEQMNIHEKAWKRNPRLIPKDWNSVEEILGIIAEVKGRGRRTGIIPKMDRLLNGELLEDFDVKKRSFQRFYWTHFIKCPGQFRNRDFARISPESLNICADSFLPKEISVVRPKLILCMGEHSSSWVLRQSGYQDKWTEILWDEIVRVARTETEPLKFEMAGLDYKPEIVVLPHPSGANPLASWLNGRLKNLVMDALVRPRHRANRKGARYRHLS